MENEALDNLENKINAVLSLVNTLRDENLELKNRNDALQRALKEKDEKIKTFQTETEQVHSMKTEVESYRNKQNRIREKVERLLDKLKEFEEVS